MSFAKRRDGLRTADSGDTAGEEPDSFHAALHGSGVAIQAIMPCGLPPMPADIDRTPQAVFVFSPGDLIELLVTPGNGEVELTVQNERACGRSLNALQRLNLALAETNIRSQNGGHKYAEGPFRVSLSCRSRILTHTRAKVHRGQNMRIEFIDLHWLHGMDIKSSTYFSRL